MQEITANLVEITEQTGRDVELSVDCNCPRCHGNNVYELYIEDYMDYSFETAYIKGGTYELVCPYCCERFIAAYWD